MTELSTAVVFIDLQEGFFEDPSSRDNRELMVTESNRLAGLARQAGIPVFVVSTVHARDTSTWTLKMLEDEQGFNFPGTPQVQLLEGLDLEPATHLEKIRDSAFHGTSLAQRLRTVGARTVILAGGLAESCIAATGRDSFAHDFRVVYARQAIASAEAETGWPLLEGLCDTLRQQILNRPDLERLLTAGG